MLAQTEKELAEHREFCPEKGSRQRVIQDYVEKETYLEFEVINLDLNFSCLLVILSFYLADLFAVKLLLQIF